VLVEVNGIIVGERVGIGVAEGISNIANRCVGEIVADGGADVIRSMGVSVEEIVPVTCRGVDPLEQPITIIETAKRKMNLEYILNTPPL
jgi:hypothetical protein